MILNGSDIMLFAAKSAGEEGKGTEVSIAFATSHTLQITQELKDIQHKDVGASGRFSTSAYGTISWSIQSENFIGNDTVVGETASKTDMKRQGLSYTALYKLMVDKKPLHVMFGIEGNSKSLIPNDLAENDTDSKLQSVPEGGWTVGTGKQYFEGWAYITDLQASAPTNDFCSMSVSLQGTGRLSLVDGAAEWMSAKEPVPVVPVATKTSKTTASA